MNDLNPIFAHIIANKAVRLKIREQDLAEEHFEGADGVELWVGDTKLTYLENYDDYMAWRMMAEQKQWFLGEKKCNVDDSIARAVKAVHYEGYVEEMEWIDAMSKIPTLRKPERFIAALELQIRKYMDRNGGKDDSLQELMKGRFYYCYLVAYMANGNKHVPAATIKAQLKAFDNAIAV